MKHLFLSPILLLPLLAGCASDGPKPPVTTAVDVITTPIGTPNDPNANTDTRNDEVVKTYPVGPYVDPSNIRHDAHNVERVEQSSTWSLEPNTPTAINMGPAVAVADPNQEKQALNGELQQQMVREQDLLKVTAEQNDAMAQEIAALKAKVQASDSDKANAELKAQIQQLQKQIDDLKNKQTSTTPDSTDKSSPVVLTEPKRERSWTEWWHNKSAPSTPPATDPTAVVSVSATPTPVPDTTDMSGATQTQIPVQTLPPITTETTTASNQTPPDNNR